jgi:hypothetical protein
LILLVAKQNHIVIRRYDPSIGFRCKVENYGVRGPSFWSVRRCIPYPTHVVFESSQSSCNSPWEEFVKQQAEMRPSPHAPLPPMRPLRTQLLR